MVTGKALMLDIGDVEKRARTAFDRNWRAWARDWFSSVESAPTLSVSLKPPREADLGTRAQLAASREWVARWQACPLGGVEWQRRSWPSVGDQSIPLRVSLEGVTQIAQWANRQQLWETALERMADVGNLLRATGCSEAESTPNANAATRTFELDRSTAKSDTAPCPDDADRPNADASTQTQELDQPDAKPDAEPCPDDADRAVAEAVRLSIADWCTLDKGDWETALRVWEWLFAHPDETRYVRQLPIRGIDTKWMERHGKALRQLHQAVAGSDFTFARPDKQFRCKACCPETTLGGCDGFSLSAAQLDALETPPALVVVCENLVNTLCLHDLPGTLAVHGSGFAVSELRAVRWLAETPLLYWGDLDSNGFAILNALRSFAPHACSLMMDAETLHRHFDLCVEEPKPATGAFDNLTDDERETLHLLAQGDPTRDIANLRLEQERIEWDWAYGRVAEAVSDT